MTRHPDLPDDDEAAKINADFLAGHTHVTGFYNELGQPAPWPDDLNHWRPSTDNQTRINF